MQLPKTLYANLFPIHVNHQAMLVVLVLNKTPFPSITGLPASGPILPRPSTAVPFDTTATRFPLAVYLYTSSIFFSISRHGSATPGLYARERSLEVRQGFVATTSTFPFLSEALYFHILYQEEP